jgi:hypothetical protein
MNIEYDSEALIVTLFEEVDEAIVFRDAAGLGEPRLKLSFEYIEEFKEMGIDYNAVILSGGELVYYEGTDEVVVFEDATLSGVGNEG